MEGKSLYKNMVNSKALKVCLTAIISLPLCVMKGELLVSMMCVDRNMEGFPLAVASVYILGHHSNRVTSQVSLGDFLEGQVMLKSREKL